MDNTANNSIKESWFFYPDTESVSLLAFISAIKNYYAGGNLAFVRCLDPDSKEKPHGYITFSVEGNRKYAIVFARLFFIHLNNLVNKKLMQLCNSNEIRISIEDSTAFYNDKKLMQIRYEKKSSSPDYHLISIVLFDDLNFFDKLRNEIEDCYYKLNEQISEEANWVL